MLTIAGDRRSRFCDGVSRRNFLQIGGLALGGLSLPDVLSAESAGGRSRNFRGHKATIMIFLAGGPPHLDMWDIKSEAPSEIRGPFVPVRTNVSGIQICEQFPRLAGMMDKLVPIRSIVGSTGQHYAFQCYSGHTHTNQPRGGWPCLGSIVSKMQGPVTTSMPPSFGLSPKTGHAPWGDNGQPGYLGLAHTPFAPTDERVKKDMTLEGITLDRLRDRSTLLASFDKFRREVDNSGAMEGMDAFNERAMGILTSSRLAAAFDLSQEDPRLRDRYGRGSSKVQADGSWKLLDQFLLARRLVERGARCVTLAFSRWDWHSNNFGRAREDMPMLDQGVSALVQDLHERGLDKDVTVVVWGEFGRTPKINPKGGRDHWPKVSGALLAGGGMRTGQVIGSTTRDGGEAKDRPVHFQEVFATILNNMGIDLNTRLFDLGARPQYLVEPQYKPIHELI